MVLGISGLTETVWWVRVVGYAELVSEVYRGLGDLASRAEKALDKLNVFCSSRQDKLVAAYARLALTMSDLCGSSSERARAYCRKLAKVSTYLAKAIYGTYSAVSSCSTMLNTPHVHLSVLEDFREDVERGDIEGLDLELKEALRWVEELGSACRDHISTALLSSKSALDAIGEILRGKGIPPPRDWRDPELEKEHEALQLLVRVDRLLSIHFASLLYLQKRVEHWHEAIASRLKALSEFLKTRGGERRESEK